VTLIAGILIGTACLIPVSTHAQTLIYNSWNADAVGNNPSILPVFTLSSPMTITSVLDYHKNDGLGGNPSGATISLYSVPSDNLVGSWPVFAVGPIPTPNIEFEAFPGITLGAGSYEVVDSDSATWSFSTTDLEHGLELTGPNWAPNVGFSMVYATSIPEPSIYCLSALGLGMVALFRLRQSKFSALS
jgi:hypothetical protein